MRCLWAAMTLLVASVSWAEAAPDDAAAPSPFEAALRKRAALDTLRRYTLTLKSSAGSDLTRRVSILSKEFGDRVYVIGAFSHPGDLRGTSFLAIDKPSGNDRFVYFPAFRMVRRVGAQQKSDSWFGTDLAMEDIEYRPARDFEVLARREGMLEGEATQQVDARPVYGSAYARIRFHIVTSDDTIVRTEYFMAGRDDPTKVVEAPRAGAVRSGEMSVPARVRCTNLDTGSETLVQLDDVDFAPDFERSFFSTRTLESWSKLKALE